MCSVGASSSARVCIYIYMWQKLGHAQKCNYRLTLAHVRMWPWSLEPSLDRSTKRVMDDTDGDDEERPAQRVVIHRRKSYTFLALGDVQGTAKTPSYSHSLSLTTSTSQQCTTKRSHLLQPLASYTRMLLNCVGTTHHMYLVPRLFGARHVSAHSA